MSRFSYDIWGDPVNIAARLENLAHNGTIHTSSEFRELVASTFVFETRGYVEIKGIGSRATWVLTGQTPT